MARLISQRELQDECSEILRELDQGEEFIITRDGEPIGELRPAKRRFVPLAELLATFRNSLPIKDETFFSDVDSILNQDPEPRA